MFYDMSHMETFQESAIQMLREFRALLQHSPLPLPGTRLLQLLALNMFAIETTQLKDLILIMHIVIQQRHYTLMPQ
ncbi:hypothetical protein PV326_004695 [Microctonus aethiopoides]|nr:hypothetical protein PV326_004695 [Microctonus aethiopoides]